jgi:hypothetical protein
MSERDSPSQPNTFKRMVYDRTKALRYARALWARRIFGVIGLFTDMMAEGATQAFFARLPGHPHQAEDSAKQVGKDRDLFRFRGEGLAAFAQRVRDAWNDYQQGGTPQQLLHVLDQWGAAGWPSSWVANTVTCVESVDPAVFEFTVTIPFGLIDPPWVPWLYGSGHVWGEAGLYYGIGPSTDIPMLLYLVRKWKPARSKGHVVIYYNATDAVTITV